MRSMTVGVIWDKSGKIFHEIGYDLDGSVWLRSEGVLLHIPAPAQDIFDAMMARNAAKVRATPD